MIKTETDQEEDVISAIFAPMEKKVVCSNLDNQLDEIKTMEKSGNKADAAVTWTSMSDVCSEILKAAGDDLKCPVEEASSPTAICNPLVGGGSELTNVTSKVNSIVVDTTPDFTEALSHNVCVPKKSDKSKYEVQSDKAQQKTGIEEKNDTDSYIESSKVSSPTVSEKEPKERKDQEKFLSLPSSEKKAKLQTLKQGDASVAKPKERLLPNRATWEKKEASKSVNRKDSKTVSKPLKLRHVERGVGKAPSRNNVNLLTVKPPIQALAKSRKRKTVRPKDLRSKKRARMGRFSRTITPRGLYSTPISSPKKGNDIVLTPLKMRKQKMLVSRHLRPFLTKLQVGGSGIKQLIRCREKLDLLRDTEWEKRLVCLDCISNIVALGDVTESELVEEMRQLKRSLKKSLEDLRSRIIICVTETIMIAAEFLGNRFLPFFSYLLPTLYKGLYVTIRVIKESNDRCITECVKAITEPRILKTLLDKKFIQDQHREVKFKTGSMLTDFLNRFYLSIEGPKIETSEITFAPYRRHTKELL